LDLLAVILNLMSGNKLRSCVGGGDHRFLFGLDEYLQVRLAVWEFGDLGQHEGIDVATGRDQIQVGLRARFGGLYVSKVLSAVDYPKLLVPAGEVQNLLTFWQHDKRRVAYFGLDFHDILFAVLHDLGSLPDFRDRCLWGTGVITCMWSGRMLYTAGVLLRRQRPG